MALLRTGCAGQGGGTAGRAVCGLLAFGCLATTLGLLGWGCGQEFTSGAEGGGPTTTTSTHSTGGHTTTSLGGGGTTNPGGGGATGLTGGGGTSPTGGGGSGPTGGGGSGPTGGSGGGAAAGGSGNAGGTGGAGNAGNTGGQGGGGPCAHDVCVVGPALSSGCSLCVQDVCGSQDDCCSVTWSELCVLRAVGLCAAPCSTSCGLLFGQVPGYQLCASAGASCTFLTTAQATCTTVCGEHGTTCTAGFSSPDCQSSWYEIGCDVSGGGAKVCTCSAA